MAKLISFVTEQDRLCVVTREQDEEDKELPPFVTISIADSLGDNPEEITLTHSDMDRLCAYWLQNTQGAVK